MFELRQRAGCCLLTVVACATTSLAVAQAATITEKRVKEAVSWLASNDRNGRASGSSELAEAGEWLVGRFAKAGLKQLREGSWYHEFGIPAQRIDSDEVALTLTYRVDKVAKKLKLEPGRDVRQWLPSHSLEGDESCTVAAITDPVLQRLLRVRAARAGLGADIDIMCDAHGTYTVAEAKRFCRGVADCDIAWFEEPVTADDKPGLAEVRAVTDIPIATGESEFTRFDFRDLALLRAADIFQPDLAIAGGITEALRIEAIASAHQIRFAAHLWGGALAFAAGLQVSAVASTGFILEYSLGANPMLRNLAHEDFVAVDGYIEIPDRPGLGVTINEDFVASARVDS